MDTTTLGWLAGPPHQDQRTSGWILTDVMGPIYLTLLYQLTIFVGQRFMEKCNALKLKLFTTIHNLFLFLLSLYMCLELDCIWLQSSLDGSMNVLCPTIAHDGVGFSTSAYRLAVVLWIHYISKAYEFVDTAIMILKKNNRQITFLHVYHHATTFFPVWWTVIVYGPQGAEYFGCALNSFVHIWMYAYYLLSGLGIKLTFFKPIVTYSQIVQFICLILQAAYMLYTDCYQPRLAVVFLIFQSCIFFILFSHFAYKTYWQRKSKLI